jgi:hypothetical protein
MVFTLASLFYDVRSGFAGRKPVKLIVRSVTSRQTPAIMPLPTVDRAEGYVESLRRSFKARRSNPRDTRRSTDFGIVAEILSGIWAIALPVGFLKNAQSRKGAIKPGKKPHSGVFPLLQIGESEKRISRFTSNPIVPD